MSFKKAVLLGSGLFAGAAQAHVLTFDDISMSGSYESMASLGESGYHGFTWDSNWYVGNTDELMYSQASHSGSQFLSNGFAAGSLSVARATAFDFQGAWFTTPLPTNPASYASDLTEEITITGYDSEGNVVGSVSSSIDHTNSFWIGAGFSDVYSVMISADHGWFAMDDFTYHHEAQPVPVPAALLLFGTGIAGLGLFSRKKASNQA